MRSDALAALFVLTLPASAVNFDQGVDAAAVLKQARAAAYAEQGSYRPDGRSYDFECREIIFSAAEKSSTLSAGLESHEILSDCPENGYRHGGSNCNERRGGITRQGSAAVTIRNRKALLPWESDTFRVCLEGTAVDFRPLDTAYEYAVVQEGSAQNGWEWIVEPGRKIATEADPEGLVAELFTDGLLVFFDRWPVHYAGEQIEIRYEVKRERSRWPDDTIARGTVNAPVSDNYVVDLLASVTDGKYDKFDLSGRHYVRFSFRRVGLTSTDKFVEPGSERVLY